MVPKALREVARGWCGCGNPHLAFEIIRDYLRYRKDAPGRTMAEFKPMDGRDYFIAYVLDAHELTEHGGSVGGCWLTKEGDEVLEFLEQLGDLDGLGDLIEEENGEELAESTSYRARPPQPRRKKR